MTPRVLHHPDLGSCTTAATTVRRPRLGRSSTPQPPARLGRPARKHLVRTVSAALALPLAYVAGMGLLFTSRRNRAVERLNSYRPETAALSHGRMACLASGNSDHDDTLLSVHGLFGGFDQGWENVKGLADTVRIVAPSRFGYPGSDTRGMGSPAEQAEAFKELLDQLGIGRVFIIGTSAGGPSALSFACCTRTG